MIGHVRGNRLGVVSGDWAEWNLSHWDVHLREGGPKARTSLWGVGHVAEI